MTDDRHQDEPDPGASEQQPLAAFLRRQRELAELTLNHFAGTVGISNAYLSQIERGLRRPSGTVLSSIASGLHLSAEAIEAYVPKAYKAAPSKVLAAIEGDDQLTGRQRTALCEMYRSFVELNASRRPQRPEENGASA
jgi:transcriptional regulator with XRE-family HTH domain